MEDMEKILKELEILPSVLCIISGKFLLPFVNKGAA